MICERDRAAGDDDRKGKSRAQRRQDAEPNQRNHGPRGFHYIPPNSSNNGRRSAKKDVILLPKPGFWLHRWI
jgi:hypothetical protein